MAFCDLSQTFHKEVTDVSQQVFVILLLGILRSPIIIYFPHLSFQPVENYSEWRLFYFISFLLLVGFFVLNMFVGVVVENFHKCRESQEQEERARRAAKRAKKLDKKRRSMGDNASSTESVSAGWYRFTESGAPHPNKALS